MAAAVAGEKGNAGAPLRAAAYGLLNIASTVGIVFVNKLVMGYFGFKFPVALTWIHTLFTAAGMEALCRLGAFKRNPLSLSRTIPLSAMYSAYIVSSNLSLKYNTVGFYQILKIAITPVVVLIEARAAPPPRRRPRRRRVHCRRGGRGG